MIPTERPHPSGQERNRVVTTSTTQQRCPFRPRPGDDDDKPALQLHVFCDFAHSSEGPHCRIANYQCHNHRHYPRSLYRSGYKSVAVSRRMKALWFLRTTHNEKTPPLQLVSYANRYSVLREDRHGIPRKQWIQNHGTKYDLFTFVGLHILQCIHCHQRLSHRLHCRKREMG